MYYYDKIFFIQTSQRYFQLLTYLANNLVKLYIKKTDNLPTV